MKLIGEKSIHADQLWFQACEKVRYQGVNIGSRDGASREVLGYRGRMYTPNQNLPLLRRPSPIYAAAELLWYLAGSQEGDHICAYAPGYKRFLNVDGHAEGAYGPRLMAQLPDTIALLQKYPDTRRAVIALYDRHIDQFDDEKKSKDVPCTLSLQFLRRKEKLSLIVTMRSSDVWLGMPYDTYCFTSIQMLVAAALGDQPGKYQIQAGSLHVYDRDREKVAEAIVRTMGTGAEPYCEPLAGPHGPRGIQGLGRAIHVATNWERWLRAGSGECPPLDVFKELGAGSVLAEALALVAVKWLPYGHVMDMPDTLADLTRRGYVRKQLAELAVVQELQRRRNLQEKEKLKASGRASAIVELPKEEEGRV